MPVLSFVLLIAACGPGLPAEPGDTGSTSEDPGTSSGTDTLTGGTSMEPPNPTTGAPEPTTGVMQTTGEVDPVDPTGGPDECLKGQVPFEPRWSTVLMPPFAFAEVHPEGGMAVMADGRVAIGVKVRDGEPPLSAPGVLFLAPTGELLGVHPGAFASNGPIHGLARSASDELVMAGRRIGEQRTPTWIARFNSDGGLVSEVEASEPIYFDAAMGLLDAPVLLGLDEVSSQTRAVRFAADGAGLEWSLALDGPPGMQGASVAPREDGSVLLVTQGAPAQGGYTRLGLQLVDSAGLTAWTREIDGPGFGQASHATATPDGWVVLRTGDWDGGVVRLTAIAAVDGATLWDTEVAAPDALGAPLATRMHLTDDHFTVPVLRSLADHPADFSNTRSIAVHRLSLQGAPIDVTPLADAPTSVGPWELDSAAGPCGELFILAPGGDLTWVGAYSP